ncbi:tape measure protein [Phocaeicola coprocola]|uniref:tape measure protein n=1 Tax=Phocaeicola coprocola TaxID=310298 RepID=UPI003AF1D155
MAQLEFNIKANFDQIKQAKQELERLRGELQKTTKATDKAVVQDLTDKYAEQKQKVTELSSAMSRYALVMSSDYAKKMQNLTREVYSFELQADASRRKIERLSSEIAKMQSKLRKGGLDVGTSTILNRDISENSTILNDEKRRYENLTGLGKQARIELQNMQAEYVRYSGSSNATTDNVKVMTDAFAGMIEEMKKVPTVGEGATSLFNRLGGDAKQLAMSLVGGLGFEQLAEHIFNVRSQFQQLEISFTTMLGSEQKAGALMNQLVQTAAKTPFDMSSITNGAKQLLAYGTAANEVNDILVHLGDISAGLSVPLNDLVYLYGTTMSQGRMYTVDLRQFMGRGIPMAEELGKIMGKTTQEVQQAVTDGKVGADLVKKAIINMTEEGGKFGGLMEKQSTTLQGKWSNIGDSVDQMFNELGKKSQGIFGTGLDLISSLVDNWETVVKVIGSAAVAVGTYKAGLMAAASIQKAQNQATLDSIASNLDEKIKAYKDEAELYHSYTGKDTSEYKSQRLSDLNKAVSNTDMLGTDKAEELVSLKIKEAQADGIITQQMAEQLQLKRDMLVTQQQSAAKEQMEALELSKGLDEKMAQFKEMENDYRHLNGKDTKDYKASRYNELGNALSDTENIGDDETEKRISKQIELAKSEGLISEEMAKQLQLKRDLLVEQTRLAEKEQLQWQNAVNAKEAAEEELRAKRSQEADIAAANKAAEQAKAEADLKQKIAKANETAYGKALLETNALQKKVDLQQESYDKAMDEAREKRVVLAQLDEEIKKQQQIIEQKEKELVYDNGAVDTTSFGGYADSFSDNENSSIVQYEAEQAKLEELMRKRQQASEEYESSNAKRKAIQQELQTTTEKLAEAEEYETEVYKETGAAADEIGDVVQQGIDIENGKISITEAATTATQANTTSEASNATAKGANANATSSETIANTANSTSKIANTAATNVNTTSENVNTGAKERNSLVTSILSVGTKGLALAQNVLTWATNAVTVSMRELWAAMLANPLTTILTLVTTAMSVFAMFGSSEEDVAKKTQDMGNKAAEASNKVRALFSTLVQASGKEADHKDVINELKSAYEQYGIQLDKTKMKSQNAADQADELLKHENELIGVIEKRAIEMERANQLQAAYDNYNSSNDETYSSFKKDSGLSDAEAGQVRNLISQDDLDKMAQLKQEMSECAGQQEVWNALNAQYKKMQTQLNAELVTYLLIQGKHKDEITDILGYFKDYTNGVVDNTIELNKNKAEVNNSANAAEKAKKAVSGLTYAQEEQALKNQYAKKSFKDLDSEIQETIKLCSRKLHLDIKVNYDDSELPAWIKNMSQSQLKASMAVRKNWLDDHKKGDVLQVGGQYKTYEQVANELAMMQARGNNIESKPKKSQKEIDKERKAREKAARDAEKARNDAETKAGNKRKAEEDYSKSISSYSEKAIQDMTKNRINAMNEGYSKELAQITENADKERKAVEEGIDKLVEARKKRDQAVWVNSGKGRKANMWKQSKTNEEYKNEVLNETMKDSKGNPVKVNGMNMTIGMSVANQMNAIRDKAVKQNEDVLAKEAQSMYDYLKTYGTFQEQKLAIAADYAKRISEVENSTDSDSSKQWKIKSLKEEQKKETDSVEASAIMQKIDWYQVFGNVGGIMKDALVPLLADLDKFVGTDKFQNLGADQQKSIVDAMQNIRNSIGNTSDLGWKDLARDVVAYQDALKNAKIAQDEYTKTETLLIPRIKVLQEQIENAKKSGNVAEQTRLQEELNKVQGQLAESGKKIVTANTKVRTSGQKLAQTTQNVTQPISAIHEFLSTSGLSDLASLWDSFDQLKGGIDGLKALKEAKNAADGLKDMGKEAADAAADAGKKAGDALSEGLSKAGLIGQIVSAILKILDVLKDGIGTLISSLIDTVLNAVNGILKNILSGDFITQIGGSLVSGIGNILNTISFGGFNSLFGVGGNAKEVNRTIDKLTDRNEILTDAIDKLRDSIDKNSGIKAVEDAKKAENLQKEKEQNLKSIMEAQMGYHGSHHSFNAYFRGFSQEQIKKVSDAIGRQWNGNLNDLQSADEAAAILQNPDMVEAIKNTGKGGYGGRVLEKLKDYAAEAGTLEEIADDLAESLTQISFDSLKSEFIDTLMDMNSSAQDFSDNFSKMLMQAVLKAKVDDLLGNDMQAFYDEWAERAEANGGKLSKTDITALKGKYDEMVQEGLKIRDEVAEITGYKQSYEQSASSGSFESMSQDTGDELNGRFTAVQIATEGTYEETKLINTKLDAIAAREGGAEGSLLTASVNTIMGNVGNIWLAVDEGRTILAQSLMYLQSIDERQERWHKPMLQAFNDIHELKDKMSRL